MVGSKGIVWALLAALVTLLIMACGDGVEGTDCKPEGSTMAKGGHVYRCDWAGDGHAVWTKVS